MELSKHIEHTELMDVIMFMRRVRVNTLTDKFFSAQRYWFKKIILDFHIKTQH
jgi:negative regulator of genetic competence, sporulation and motility